MKMTKINLSQIFSRSVSNKPIVNKQELLEFVASHRSINGHILWTSQEPKTYWVKWKMVGPGLYEMYLILKNHE